MKLGRGSRRAGLSAIVVEFVLVVISLIACIVLGGFTFGTIQIYVPPAEVAAQASSCSAAGNHSFGCMLTLNNQGSRNVATDGICSLNVSGGPVNGTISDGGTVPAGGALTGVQCIADVAGPTSGALVTGSISLNDGGMAYFTSRAA